MAKLSTKFFNKLFPEPPPPVYKACSEDEKNAILEKHSKWLEAEKENSAGDASTGAKFDNLDLHDFSFVGADLTRASLRGVNLQKVSLVEATLTGADFYGADLSGADLSGCELRDASFLNANLENVNLAGATNITQLQVRGANIHNVKIEPARTEPAIVIEGTAQVDEGLKNAGKLYLTLLSLCVFSVLVVLSTKHSDLILDSGQTKLPIVDTQIPIRWFYWLTPALIVATSITFHLHLLRAWEAMADLPAVFADGKTIYHKVYPLQINSMILQHWPQLRGKNAPLMNAQALFSRVTAYGLAPASLLFFWWYYLVKQSWWSVNWHVFLFAFALLSGRYFWRLSFVAIRDQPLSESLFGNWRKEAEPRPSSSDKQTSSDKQVWWETYKGWLARLDAGWRTVKLRRTRLFWSLDIFLALILPFLYGIPMYAPWFERMQNKPPEDWNWTDKLWRRPIPGLPMRSRADILRDIVTANLSGVELTPKPDKWIDRPKSDPETSVEKEKDEWKAYKAQFSTLKNAPALRYASLRFVHADGAFLAKADLTGADMFKADFSGACVCYAIMREANLPESDLRNADLSFTNMRDTDLRKANLNNAFLYEADLRKAKMNGADLTGADLRKAKMNGANLTDATYTVKGKSPTHWPVGYNYKGAHMREVDENGEPVVR